MYKVKVNYHSGVKEYICYTKEEADEMNINYKHWSEAKKGDWCITDDNVVAKVFYVNDYKKGARYIRCPWGRYIGKPSRKLEVLKFKSRQGKSFAERAQSSKRTRLFAKYMAQRYNVQAAAEWLNDGKAGPSTIKYWTKRLNTRAVQKMIGKELENLLEERGFSKGDVIDLMKYVVDVAKKEKKLNILMEMIGNLQKMHGIDEPDSVKTHRVLEEHKKRMSIDEVVEEERRITIKDESPKLPEKVEVEDKKEIVEVEEVGTQAEQEEEA